MPRIELAELVAPGRTALVTRECQGAVVGSDAGLVELAAEVRGEAVPNTFATRTGCPVASRKVDIDAVRRLLRQDRG